MVETRFGQKDGGNETAITRYTSWMLHKWNAGVHLYRQAEGHHDGNAEVVTSGGKQRTDLKTYWARGADLYQTESHGWA